MNESERREGSDSEDSGVDPPALDDVPDIEDEVRTVGEMVLDISERLTLLVREEIQLAKTEISEKVGKLLRGSAAAAAAALFLVLCFAMLMHTFAWLLNDLFFEGELWAGFLVSALIWLLLAVIAGAFAYRSMRAGAPPTPDMAIEEARRTSETMGIDLPDEAAEVPAETPAAAPAPDRGKASE